MRNIAFLFGLVAGMRTMTAASALAFAAAREAVQPGWRFLAPARLPLAGLALAEMAGDKLPFAPDRRIAPSFAFRLAIGAAGGLAFAGDALPGLAGALLGTLGGRAARGGTTRSAGDWARALGEDAGAAGLAAVVVTRAGGSTAYRRFPTARARARLA